ncbi:hypothetical protein HNQ56_001312 [Anaerotaenia torta]
MYNMDFTISAMIDEATTRRYNKYINIPWRKGKECDGKGAVSGG